MRPHVTSPSGAQGFLQGELVNISGYVDDDCTERTGQNVEGADIDPDDFLRA
jgi:hypothetical protein